MAGKVFTGAVSSAPAESRVDWRQWLQMSQSIMAALANQKLVMTLLLALTLIASAAAVIGVSHWNRQLFIELNGLEQARDAYQIEWGQLLLEQSAWTSQGRIEHLAVSRLGMKVPAADDVVMVK